MERYAMVLRTAISTLVVPGVLFVYVLFSGMAWGIGHVFLTSLVAGFIIGIAGTALEPHIALPPTRSRRFLYWALITTAVIYFTKFFAPLWPITLFGALLMGIVVGALETILPAKIST